jgi:hypothetical protein
MSSVRVADLAIQAPFGAFGAARLPVTGVADLRGPIVAPRAAAAAVTAALRRVRPAPGVGIAAAPAMAPAARLVAAAFALCRRVRVAAAVPAAMSAAAPLGQSGH